MIEQLRSRVDALIQQAGDAILEVYDRNDAPEVSTKADQSPLTEADRAAHNIIANGLHGLTPDWPVLSEESAMQDYDIRKKWSVYWLVDPLDGTKEFIKRNGEFTVNIALIRDGEPVAGWVWVPVKRVLYHGHCDGRVRSAVRIDNGIESAINTRSLSESSVDVVASRSHGSDQLETLMDRISARFGAINRKSMGSSLKICLVAEGEADWYPRLAPTSEWDTAAAHAVLRGAGGEILDTSMAPLRYNQKADILNPHFHALGDMEYNWKSLLA